MMDAYWNASYSFDLSVGRHLITVLGLPPLPHCPYGQAHAWLHIKKKNSYGGCLHVLGSSVRIVSFCVCPGVSSTAHLCSSVYRIDSVCWTASKLQKPYPPRYFLHINGNGIWGHSAFLTRCSLHFFELPQRSSHLPPLCFVVYDVQLYP